MMVSPLSTGADLPVGRSRPIAASSLDSDAVLRLATEALDDLKGLNITTIDVRDRTSIADAMLVCTGTSQRHVSSLAENVRLACKQADHPPLGIEGDNGSDWVLVDLGDVIVHVMTEEMREFYSLEKLWSVGPDRPAGTASQTADDAVDAGADDASDRTRSLHAV